MQTNRHAASHLAQLFLEQEMSQEKKKKIAEKIKMHILCSVTFLFENRAAYEIMWEIL